MPNRSIPVLLLTAQVLVAPPGFAMPDARSGALCDQAARRAAVSEGVPLDVLMAIARVETGRTRDGQFAPWPWTINVNGTGHWFDSEIKAKAYVFDIFKAGERSFDIGCFQINYRWHGKAFRSIDAMFDPDENATYAAGFLKELYSELGSWSAAAGAYHSRTNALAAAYRERYQTVLAQLQGADLQHPLTPVGSTRIRAAAPLVPVQSAPPQQNALGSLVPATNVTTAFINFN